MQRRVILIFGKTGSGKSTLSKRIISQFERVIVFDPLEEYSGLVVFSYEEFVEYFREYRPTFHVVCRFENEEDYEKVAMGVWYIENVLLVLEEVETYLNSYDRQSYINHLIAFGRHKRISILGIGRRPVEVPIKLRAQCSSIFSFQQTEPPDIMYLEKWGFEPRELLALDFSKHEFVFLGEPIEQISTRALPGLAQWTV
jgi:hypothetical protein